MEPDFPRPGAVDPFVVRHAGNIGERVFAACAAVTAPPEIGFGRFCLLLRGDRRVDVVEIEVVREARERGAEADVVVAVRLRRRRQCDATADKRG
ncbi:hypothetical protein D3C83_47540 [compost metagenome]